MSQGSQWVWEVMESYCCEQEGHVFSEERIRMIRRTGNSEEEVYEESDKLHEEKTHVEGCRTAVARRQTFPVKSSAPQTSTNSRPKGRPMKPAVQHHR